MTVRGPVEPDPEQGAHRARLGRLQENLIDFDIVVADARAELDAAVARFQHAVREREFAARHLQRAHGPGVPSPTPLDGRLAQDLVEAGARALRRGRADDDRRAAIDAVTAWLLAVVEATRC